MLYHLPRLYVAIPRAGGVVTHFDPEDENRADAVFHVVRGLRALGDELDNVSQTGLFCACLHCSNKITGLQSYSFCHSGTFPRQARLLASFFLSGWRPAPERERAATAIMLRRFGFFILVRFAIEGSFD